MSGPRVYLASAPGVGGIGVLLVIGEGAVGIVAQALVPPAAVPPQTRLSGQEAPGAVRPAPDGTAEAIAARLRSGDPVFGTLHDASGPVDEAMCRWTPADRSPTGAEAVEVDVHGSPLSLARCAAALAGGAEPADAAELPDRLAAAQGWDAVRRDALRALFGARTRLAAAMLVDQVDGALSRALAAPPDAAALEDLLATAATGMALVRPPRVAIVGPPNAGKSTLFNRLVGRDRALVHETPGTTRDPVEAEIAIQGIPFVLCDTAGLRETEHPVERLGIEETRRTLQEADAAILVWDGTRGLEHFGRLIADEIGTAAPYLCVANKIDRLSPRDAAGWVESLESAEGVAISALHDRGIDEVETALLRLLRIDPQRVGPGRPMVFLPEQRDVLEAALLRHLPADPEAAARLCHGLLGA